MQEIPMYASSSANVLRKSNNIMRISFCLILLQRYDSLPTWQNFLRFFRILFMCCRKKTVPLLFRHRFFVSLQSQITRLRPQNAIGIGTYLTFWTLFLYAERGPMLPKIISIEHGEMSLCFTSKACQCEGL